MARSVGPILFSLAVALAVPASLTAARARTDAWDRPALINPQAFRSPLLAVARAGPRLVAVGERGIIVVSDGDHANHATWTQAPSPVSQTLTGVFFVDDRNGWAVGHGGVVLHSDDGGWHWVKQRDGRRAAKDAADAAASAPLVGEGPDTPLFDVWFGDKEVGLACGAFGTLLATSDGGKTWRSAPSRLDQPEGRHLYAFGASKSGLYMVGERGAVFRSTDGGRHFAAQRVPYQGTFFGLAASVAGVVAYGFQGNAVRWDGADGQWRRVATGTGETLAASTVLPDGTILLGDQAGEIRASHDGGRTFASVKPRGLPPLTGLVAAPDGGLVATAMDGVHQLEPPGGVQDRRE